MIQVTVLATACLFFPSGCTDSLTAPEAEQETATLLDVEPDSVTLAQGDTVRMEAIPRDPQGNPVSGYDVIWTSENTTVATVESGGIAVGHRSGSATIVASAKKQGSTSLSSKAKLSVGNETVDDSAPLLKDIKPSKYETDTTAAGEEAYVDRGFTITDVPLRFEGWTYVRTANDDKSVKGESAVTFTLTDTATVALAYDERATSLPHWLENWTDTDEVLGTTEVGHDIFTRVFAPGEVALGGNQSGGAEGAQSMYVLFSAPSSSPPDPLGRLEATASTSGEDQDSDGYTVTVDGEVSKDLGPNGSAPFSGLEAGNHQVELTGIASNCTVDGQNPRTVSVETGNTRSTSLSVSCSSATGSLEVSASTSGEDQDSDGYTVTVDGDASKEIGPNGSATFSGLSEGDHQVELTGIKSNCSVDGENPRTVSVEADTTLTDAVGVTCSTTAGALKASASTSGDDPDSDGYTVTIDGSTSKDIGPNGSTTFSGLAEGDHSVELSDVANNCSVEGSNPRTVTVEAGNTASTGYSVSCTSTTGTLEVSASTSGDDPDSDGYTVTVDGSTSKDLGPNGSVTFSDLEVGDHTIELSGIKSNCSVEGQNPRTVSVEGGNTASAAFDVSCEAVSEPTIESATINSAGSQITLAFDQAVTLGPNHEDAHLNPIDDTPNDDPTMSYASGEGTSSLVFDLSRTFLQGESPSIHYDQPGDGIQATGSGADLPSFSDFTVTNNSTQSSTLEVSASTSGDDPDSDGYTVTVNSPTSQESDLGPNGSATFSDLEVGDHTIELSGIKSNCSVNGQNPRTVSVTAGNTASTSYSVTCSATTGSLEVSASTSGDDPDSDGYTVTVDGSTSKDLGPNGSVTFSDLEAGDHTVELSGLQSNCSVDGTNPQTVSVDAGNTASAAFDVSCEAVSEPTIESATINSAGSQITLAFDQAVALGPNHEDAHLNPIDDTPNDNPTMSYASGAGTSSLVFDLSRTFLQGETPSIHYDQPGDGIQASGSGADLPGFSGFAVTNNSTQGGTLEVSASTSGDDPDSDGYTATVDGSTSKEIGPNGSATFSDLEAGDHTVELSGLKSNCSVDGQNPRSVSIETGGNTISTSFDVNCTSSGLQAVEIPDQSDFTDHGKILDGGECGDWDWWLQGISSVIRQDGTTYMYYYAARGDRPNTPGDPINDCSTEDGDEANRFLGVATSTDNRNFSKSSSNPIIEHQPGNPEQNDLSFEGGALLGASPGVINGDNFIYIGGLEEHSFEDVDSDIVYYDSQDGITFGNKNDAILNESRHSADTTPECEELYPMGAVKMGGTYHMYINPKGGQCPSSEEDLLWHFESTNPSDFGENGTKVDHNGSDLPTGGAGGDAIAIDDNTILFTMQDCIEACPVDVYSADTASPASFTKEDMWDWGSQAGDPENTMLFLDRESGEWLLFYRHDPEGESTGNNEIHLKTAPVQYAN